jgi:peptidoglycan-N-acetylglucosamine deacetylase
MKILKVTTKIAVSIALSIWSLGTCFAATDVSITVINLPAEFEDEEIALAGFFNDWNSSSSTAVVSNNTLTLTFSDITLTPLGDGWFYAPEGANAAFGYFEPGTWNQRILGNYGSNDNNFRIRLSPDINNIVVIDAQYNTASNPILMIDQMQAITVNGEIQLPSGSIANLEINVSNLPTELNGTELALAGSMNGWNNNQHLATVTDHAISFSIENVPIPPLGVSWSYAPHDANAAFSFVLPGTWTQKIMGNFYGLNDNHFRVTLIADSDNFVEIDAQYKVASSPAVVIDQNQGLTVNGSAQIPPPILADASITVINLPDDFNGIGIALVGSVADSEADPPETTISNNTINFSVEDIELLFLDNEWTDAPLDGNATFAFMTPQSELLKIGGDYNNKNNFFRIRLAGDMKNRVVIDAAHSQDTSPMIININKGIEVNGNLQVPNRSVDPTKFAWPGGKWKALVMSYDDGPEDDSRMVELFNANGIVGTFNLASDFLNRADFLASSQVKDLFVGHEVANHSVHHPYLAQLDTVTIKNELKNCRDVLSGLVEYDIHGLAYPFGGIGTYDYRVIDIAQNLGIRYARTTNDSYSLEIPSNLPDGLMQWSPTVNDWDAPNFSNELLSWNQERMALLYMWGHSHFLDEAGWTRLTTFCETVGGNNDIWYAQNIEVADYLRAINNLIYKEDGVRNPSPDIAVWMKTEDGFDILEPTPVGVDQQWLSGDHSLEFCSYPNPADNSTTIQFKLPERNEVHLSLFDLQGRHIQTIANENMAAGNTLLNFNSSFLEDGVYLIKLNTCSVQSSNLLIVRHQ